MEVMGDSELDEIGATVQMRSQLPVKARKKRIPKACGSCRLSKVKCDGQRPCSRCRNLKKTCTFVERPRDPRDSKIELLENEVESLKARLLEARGDRRRLEANHQMQVARHQQACLPDLDTIIAGSTRTPCRDGSEMQPSARQSDQTTTYTPALSMATALPTSNNLPALYSLLPNGTLSGADKSPAASMPSAPTPSTRKRKRYNFDLRNPLLPDFVAAGLLTMEQARSYFDAFFQGCDRYVPVFDLRHDSMESIRMRSGLLFSAICTVGCRVLSGTESRHWHLLNFHIRRMLNVVVTNPSGASLETVQALLVRACYVPERSLLVAIATRMALDLGLPDAYHDMVSSVSMARGKGVAAAAGTTITTGLREDEATLMSKTRTWLHLLVLGHILHVDAGDVPTFGFRDDVRRCRLVLDSPYSTDLDLRLFAQVELNVLRAKIYEALSNCPGGRDSEDPDEEMMELVDGARVDIEVWFNDWIRIVERCNEQLPRLRLNLRVQRCWAITMALCRAIRSSGVENVNDMSPTQRSFLLMAKEALKEHLIITIEEPRLYLQELPFAMDFVWAKCAFCFLLLLKLSLLLPDEDKRENWDLVEKGSTLLTELTKVSGGLTDGGPSNTSKLYLQLLQASLEKYRLALRGDGGSELAVGAAGPANGDGGADMGRNRVNTPHTSAVGPHGASSSAGGHSELESFVPEQFVFEWDFPGLTLFSSPTTEAGWLDDLLLGALNAGDDFYGVGWGPMNIGL
ncbi:hypothetical protein VTK73DRAFT_9585 [Phialemonium thermophilum]|uniref:Zn(2)-C6 fungal-type domain-containing protein n=1 Tax=Phialemonium thermophilum TaxID=223376 RepID=A0ABR3XLI7_9PEZI